MMKRDEEDGMEMERSNGIEVAEQRNRMGMGIKRPEASG